MDKNVLIADQMSRQPFERNPCKPAHIGLAFKINYLQFLPKKTRKEPVSCIRIHIWTSMENSSQDKRLTDKQTDRKY